ncbi:MAG: hypothetical protein K6G50_12610 [bacterium]|nr:hypothetical protein [bacterium]
MFVFSAILQKKFRRGSVLVMTLLVLLVLFLLGISYLAIIRRDYRFAAINERNEQAWFLAKAGLEYYRSESADDLLKQRNIKLPGTPSGKRLASGALPKDSNTHFFEVVQLKNGDIAVRGVVIGTMTSSRKKQSVVERTIIVPAEGMEASYDISCFADVK